MEELRRSGYLAMAVVNFVSFLGNIFEVSRFSIFREITMPFLLYYDVASLSDNYAVPPLL